MKKTLLISLFALVASMAFGQLNMTLFDQLPYPAGLSSLWGWVDPDNGDEYALVGSRAGFSIVSLVDPSNVVEVGFIPDVNSTWREVKSYDHYGYAVTEGGGGVLIVDLHDAPNSFQSKHWAPNIPGLGTLNSIHTIWIDPDSGLMYLPGSNLNGGGTLIVDVKTDPWNPIYIGKTDNEYVHDCYSRGNYLYNANIYAGHFTVWDNTNPANPVKLATQITPAEFTHNVWLNDASNVIFTTDEVSGAPVAAYDISDLNNIKELDRFEHVPTIGQNVIPHNVHVWNDYVITAYYTNGCIIFDGSKPDNLIEIGNFDTFIGGGGFQGVWGVYPYYPSGIVIASDMQNGLFVFDVNYVRACWLEGKVTSSATGQPISGADVWINSPQANIGSSDVQGNYKTGQAIPGTFDVTFSAVGYYSKTVPATLENGVLTILNVQLDPIASFVVSGQAVKASDGTAVPGAKIFLDGEQSDFEGVADGNGNFTISVFGGEYDLYAGAWGYKTRLISGLVVDNTTEPVVVELEKGYQDDFILDLGWTTTQSSSSGFWEKGEPVGTDFNGDLANTDSDISGDLGDQCYITGNGGGAAGDDDVDNGVVTLTSPVMDLTGYDQPVLRYNAWFFNGGGNGAPNDHFEVRVSNGTQTVVAENITQSGSAWRPQSVINLGALLPITNNMRVIFETSDLQGSGHIVEAAVDAFLVENFQTGSPVAAFISNVSQGCAPLTVQFNDQTLGTPTSWEWSFPGGTPATSTEQNPTIVYNAAGVYSVTLKASNPAGSSELTLNQLITVNDVPSVDYTATVNGAQVTFLNNSANATFYEWDFGDGTTSNLLNPSHSYTANGTYEVTLTAQNQCGASVLTKTFNIIINNVKDLEESAYLLKATPNPFRSQALVTYELKENFEDARLVVYNTIGKQVANIPLTTRQGQVQLEDYIQSNGLYLLHLVADGKSGKAIQLVKFD
jgi:choice-of-anchor B domain-containing protein